MVDILANELSRMTTLNELKFRTKICRRVLKELLSYEKEVESDSTKTSRMHESGADPHDSKQQENLLAESKMMVPECRERLQDALSKLQVFFISGLSSFRQWHMMTGCVEHYRIFWIWLYFEIIRTMFLPGVNRMLDRTHLISSVLSGCNLYLPSQWLEPADKERL